MSVKRSMFRLLSGLALSGATIATTLSISPVQPSVATSQGVCIFGCSDRDYQLNYSLERNTPRNPRARYYLRVRGTRMERATSALRISYPEAFTDRRGRFDPDQIEVRRGGGRGRQEMPIDEVVWVPEAGELTIYMAEDIPADTSFVIVMSGVRNPNNQLSLNFKLHAESRGDVLPRYIGSWPMSIAYD